MTYQPGAESLSDVPDSVRERYGLLDICVTGAEEDRRLQRELAKTNYLAVRDRKRKNRR